MWSGVWSVGLLGLVAAGAQEPQPSDTQRLRQTQYELNVCDMTARQARKTLTEELRQAVERAEKAEQALALAQEELKKRAPKTEPEKAKE
jgi:hypothetical protein